MNPLATNGLGKMRNENTEKIVVITNASRAWAQSAQGVNRRADAQYTARIRGPADNPTQSGGKALAASADVTHSDQVKQLVDAA